MVAFLSTSHLSGGSKGRVSIVLAVDRHIHDQLGWRSDLERMVKAGSRYFGSRFGIRFKIANVTLWHPHGASFEDYIDALRAQVGVKPDRIVVGLTLERPEPRFAYGLTCYQDAMMVLSLPGSPPERIQGFLHEMAHVFGALHLRGEPGLMSAEERTDELEPVNEKLIALNRDRRFAPHLFPLSPEKLETAISLYEQVLDEAFGEATLLLAQIAIETGDYQKALTNAKELLEVDPDRVEAQNLRGIALTMLGQLQESVATYQRALELRPGCAHVHYNLAIAFEKMGDAKAALDSYERAIELQPMHMRALSNLARLRAQRGEGEKAADLARRALSIMPDFTEARVNLALAHLERAQPTRALEEARRALEQNPNLPEAHEVAGTALLDSGRPQEAAMSFSRAAKLQPTEPRFSRLLAFALEKSGQRDKSRKSLERLLRLYPGDVPWPVCSSTVSTWAEVRAANIHRPGSRR
jgi:tetratricopeptide (TPR) repeat protein